MKELVAKALAERVQDGEVIGLGSGSTAEMAVDEIGRRIKEEGIAVSGVPTSHGVALMAKKAGINVLSSVTDVPLAWAFDGADEVDPEFNMIKGRGAAMLSEKIIAERAERLVIIVTEDKMVDRLGVKFAVPVEIIPEAIHLAEEGLSKLKPRSIEMRMAEKKYGPVITEHNNLILDVAFDHIDRETEKGIKLITGVVESGLFFDFDQELLVAKADGVWSQQRVSGEIKETLLAGAS